MPLGSNMAPPWGSQAAQCSLVQNIYFGLQKIGNLCPKNRRKIGNYRPKMAFYSIENHKY